MFEKSISLTTSRDLFALLVWSTLIGIKPIKES